MKKYLFLLGVAMLGTMATLSAQSKSAPEVIEKPTAPSFFVIKAGDKVLETKALAIELDDQATDKVYIHPNWISSMEVVKGKNATDRYGDRAMDGVVVIILEKNGWEHLRKEDQEKFHTSK
jgi:hypothetical protein